jgi:hypothetical protein
MKSPTAAQKLFLAHLRDEAQVNQISDGKKTTILQFFGVQRMQRHVEEALFSDRRRLVATLASVKAELSLFLQARG